MKQLLGSVKTKAFSVLNFLELKLILYFSAYRPAKP